MPRSKKEKKERKIEEKIDLLPQCKNDYDEDIKRLVDNLKEGERVTIMENVELCKLYAGGSNLPPYISLDCKIRFPDSKAFYRSPLNFRFINQFDQVTTIMNNSMLQKIMVSVHLYNTIVQKERELAKKKDETDGAKQQT